MVHQNLFVMLEECDVIFAQAVRKPRCAMQLQGTRGQCESYSALRCRSQSSQPLDSASQNIFQVDDLPRARCDEALSGRVQAVPYFAWTVDNISETDAVLQRSNPLDSLTKVLYLLKRWLLVHRYRGCLLWCMDGTKSNASCLKGCLRLFLWIRVINKSHLRFFPLPLKPSYSVICLVHGVREDDSE